MRLFAILLSFVLAIPVAAPAEVTLIGPKGEQKISATELAALPQSTVTIDDHGKVARFKGVELQALLARVGAPAGEHLRGKELLKYVVVDARDGYSALFSLAELSAAFTDRKVILALERDGAPLTQEQGPFRVAVDGEKKMGRCVRQVTAIRVVDAK